MSSSFYILILSKLTPNRLAPTSSEQIFASSDAARSRQYVFQCMFFGFHGKGSIRLPLPPILFLIFLAFSISLSDLFSCWQE